MNPNAEETYRILGLTLALEGQLDEALRVLRETVAMPDSGTYSRATLAYVLGRAGQEAEARSILGELEARAATEYVSPVAFATIFIGLGEYDRAMDCLEQAYEARSGGIFGVKGSFLFASLREEPRFKALLRKMNLA